MFEAHVIRNVGDDSRWREGFAWAVGIFEGEGTMQAVKSRGRVCGIQVLVGQKDPEILYRLQQVFGGYVKEYWHAGSGPGGNGGYYWRWYMNGKAATRFLRKAWPFLSQRRQEQIEAVFERCSHLPSVNTA